MNIDRETKIINGLFDPPKRERYREFVRSEKGRLKLLSKLYHFADFDPNCIELLSGASNSADGLIAELRLRGAPDQCYVMSVHQELDGATRALDIVIREVFGSVFDGTIVCCIPGVLAYYEGEAPNNRFLLHRKRSNQ